MAKKKARAPERMPVDFVDLKDRINLVCDVVQTVVDALNDHNSLPAAMTLLRHGLYPLIEIKEELSEGDGVHDDEE